MFGNFVVGHSKWSKLFPGVRTKLTTLAANVRMPLQREFILSCGVSAATEKCLKLLLNQSNNPNDQQFDDGCTSNAVGLVVGGMRETGYTYPNTYRFVVAKRRGFIRIAYETGASLVPAISFGENDIYKPIYITSEFWLRIFRYFGWQKINAAPALPNGRGFLQYNFGMIPIRQPINTVIGTPIHLEKCSNPTTEQLNKTHELFCDRLIELFETHKSKYVKNAENVHIELV